MDHEQTGYRLDNTRCGDEQPVSKGGVACCRLNSYHVPPQVRYVHMERGTKPRPEQQSPAYDMYPPDPEISITHRSSSTIRWTRSRMRIGIFLSRLPKGSAHIPGAKIPSAAV